MNSRAGGNAEEDDLRLLGRLLGDVIREAEGEETYRFIEQVRRLSVAFRRHSDPDADRKLKNLLGLAAQDRLALVARAFTYFGHLANIADDREQLRAMDAESRADLERNGSIDTAVSRVVAAGIPTSTVAERLRGFHVSPVLTAHPSEIRRKSVLDVSMPSWRRHSERVPGRLSCGWGTGWAVIGMAIRT